jgi:hypothetical protein
MEEKNKNHLRLVVDNESPELASVAAAIQPLPQDVEPSPEFLGELRMRLLELEPRRKKRTGNSRRAA